MPDYRVNLCLVASNTKEAFGKRFPSSSASSWWDLTLPANTDDDLKTELDRRIRADCLNIIEKDLGAGAGDVLAFVDVTTAWHPLGGGQHEYVSCPIRVDYGDINPKNWDFIGEDGKKHQMFAGVRFYDKSWSVTRRKKKAVRHSGAKPKRGSNARRKANA